MHKIKVRNLKRNEVGKFDPDVSDWRNPYKAVIKFEDLIKLPELAHYDGSDDCVIMTNAEYGALTSGKNYLVPSEIVEGLKTVSHMTLDLLRSCEKGEA